MKPDTAGGIDVDAEAGVVVSTVRRNPAELAHLTGPPDACHRTYRHAASADLAGLLRRFWIPVWSVPPGEEAPQRILQDPACLVVIGGDYARFYGVAPELSTTTLSGDGWAVGLVLAPAAGHRIAGPVGDLNDRYVDLEEVLGDDGRAVADRVRSLMAPNPHDPAAHRAVMGACEDTLRRFLPLDADGELVNALVAAVENDRELLQVAQICERFDIGERALQRLLRRRLGLTPKCLIQRRRLQAAAERLRRESTTQADLAAAVGYADQAHMIRDFVHVTGTTPGQFPAAQRS
ncbi:helix-turn-helix domain-containing protein [Actinoplanes teichomyceticus]|uniref:AraC family transcriptional regulator n=1 Tax=Actinoplanes teichomyceticus TaxID=1867 RepID=A0A561WSB1_ACTTI|nr:helix-turn-helix domain-containing protein [Actinoplanes teichomyceticus]TWG26736.1 AraC family transcriptional regulator [Actinoplanes teichomyceticus]GIF15135.1 AraC family transcriptional regulator [Actinoplanes teichomyceticus]